MKLAVCKSSRFPIKEECGRGGGGTQLSNTYFFKSNCGLNCIFAGFLLRENFLPSAVKE